MKKVGLTGGIGSGKSTVIKIFSAVGIPYYGADERSKYLLNTNDELKENLIAAFGDIYKDGKIDKLVFASIIFSNDVKRKQANDIIHPIVANDFEKWVLEQKAPYLIKESALLFETGAYRSFDKNILISSPIEIRIRRLLKRGALNEDQIRARIDAQWSDEQKSSLADYSIINDGRHSLIKQVLEIHEELIS